MIIIFFSYQESSSDEYSDGEATESDENEPPQKRPALSPFQSLQTLTTFSLETMPRFSAGEKQILLQTKPLEKRNKYVPVPDKPIIVKYIPKETLPFMGSSSHHSHNFEKSVITQTFTGNRPLLPIIQNTLIAKDGSSSITPSNNIVQDSRTPDSQSDIVVQGCWKRNI